MMASGFVYKSGPIFPIHFRVFGLIVLVIGASIILFKPVLSSILILIGFSLIQINSGTEFNIKENRIRELYSIFFIKVGKWEDLKNTDKIFIKPSSKSTYVYTRVNSGTSVKTDGYSTYLKFSDDDTWYLGSEKTKEKAMKKAEELANYLETPMEVIDS